MTSHLGASSPRLPTWQTRPHRACVSHRDASHSHVTAASQQQRAAPHPHWPWPDPTDSPFAPLRSDRRRPARRCIPMWRRGAHADAAHHLPTAGPGAGASSSTAAASAGSAAAARRRRRPGLPCRPSHLFFALLVALFTASLLVVWQLLPIGDGDGGAAEGDGEAPPRLEGGQAGAAMPFSSSSLVLRAFDGESRLEAARSERRRWASLAPVRVAIVSAPLLTCAFSQTLIEPLATYHFAAGAVIFGTIERCLVF